MLDSDVNDSFLSKTKFSKMIEKNVLEKNMSYIDSVIYLCEENNIDIEDSKKYISNVIKSKIEVEAMNLNFIPKGNSLPI